MGIRYKIKYEYDSLIMLRTSAAMSDRSRRYSDYALTISTSSQVRLARNPLPDSPSEAMYVQMSIRSSSARVVRTIRILSRRRKPAPRFRFYLINRHGKPRRAVDPLPPKTPKLLDSDHLRYTLDAPFRDCLEHRLALRRIFATLDRGSDFGGKIIRQRNL
jgi:hypothetical protein